MTKRTHIQSFSYIVLLAVAVALFSGCSAVMAAKQPSRKNLGIPRPGTERDVVLAEFGSPVAMEKTEDGKKEIFSFIQGYSKVSKASRSFFHAAADVCTLGVWEVVGTPIEGSFDGKKVTVRVIFDANDRIKDAKVISITNK